MDSEDSERRVSLLETHGVIDVKHTDWAMRSECESQGDFSLEYKPGIIRLNKHPMSLPHLAYSFDSSHVMHPEDGKATDMHSLATCRDW